MHSNEASTIGPRKQRFFDQNCAVFPCGTESCQKLSTLKPLLPYRSDKIPPSSRWSMNLSRSIGNIYGTWNRSFVPLFFPARTRSLARSMYFTVCTQPENWAGFSWIIHSISSQGDKAWMIRSPWFHSRAKKERYRTPILTRG